MKKPYYELIENAVIYISGSIGIILGLLMVACYKGECYIGSLICLVLSGICMNIGVRTWEMSESRKGGD